MYRACLQQYQNRHLHPHLWNQKHTFEQISFIMVQFTSYSGLRIHGLGSSGVKLIQKWASGIHTVWTLGPQHQFFFTAQACSNWAALVKADAEISSSVWTSAYAQPGRDTGKIQQVAKSQLCDSVSKLTALVSQCYSSSVISLSLHHWSEFHGKYLKNLHITVFYCTG